MPLLSLYPRNRPPQEHHAGVPARRSNHSAFKAIAVTVAVGLTAGCMETIPQLDSRKPARTVASCIYDGWVAVYGTNNSFLSVSLLPVESGWRVRITGEMGQSLALADVAGAGSGSRTIFEGLSIHHIRNPVVGCQ